MKFIVVVWMKIQQFIVLNIYVKFMNEINGPYNYLGYDINEYIACQLFPCVLSFKNLTLGIFNPTKIFSSIITGKIISIDTLKEIRKNDTYY